VITDCDSDRLEVVVHLSDSDGWEKLLVHLSDSDRLGEVAGASQ
jgi:hypothetical protein